MKEIVMEGKKIMTPDELHAFLKKELDFPDYYGMNLHALWDCITCHITLPVKIIWNNLDESRIKLGGEFVDCILRLFARAKVELGDEFDYEIR